MTSYRSPPPIRRKLKHSRKRFRLPRNARKLRRPRKLRKPPHPASAERTRAGQVRNDQPDTTNAVVNAEADQTVTPPTPLSSQAASKGFIADSHLNLQFRNYSDYFQAPTSIYRHAWVQGAQANYESGFTQGVVGFGVDASLFAALKLDGGNGAGNMVHVGKDGGGSQQLAWAYPGMYDIKGRISETVVKYGLQQRHQSVPRTARQPRIAADFSRRLDGQQRSGSYDAGGRQFHQSRRTRPHEPDQPDHLVRRHTHRPPDLRGRHVALCKRTAKWRSMSTRRTTSGVSTTARWRSRSATRPPSSGAASPISTRRTTPAHHVRGISTATHTACLFPHQHGPHALLLGYQQVLGDQFFDYVNETNGIYLTNSMDVDYNAPHEQSLQLRYTFDGKYAGVPGLKAMFWGEYGWGADASAGAADNASASAPLHNLYWKERRTGARPPSRVRLHSELYAAKRPLQGHEGHVHRDVAQRFALLLRWQQYGVPVGGECAGEGVLSRGEDSAQDEGVVLQNACSRAIWSGRGHLASARQLNEPVNAPRATPRPRQLAVKP